MFRFVSFLKLTKANTQIQIFDCDFNQQLGIGIGSKEIHSGGLTVFDLNSFEELMNYEIKNDNHCFGCTAGMGSS